VTESLPFIAAVGSASRRRLIESAQRGDPRAREELVRRYEPLVQRVVWKLRLPPGCEREDLAQEARLGLLAAIRAWRPERGPFPAFADRCVTNQALLAVKAACAHKHQVLSLAASLDRRREGLANPTDDGAAPALLDTLAAPRDPRADPEARLLVREQLTSMLHALPTLTASERAGLAMALNGESYKRPAPTFAGTPKAASQAAYRARRKLAAAAARAA
jgi:RNA polymerase sigma factor (sigma-70 family)